ELEAKALDIVNAGADITDEQLQALRDDADLRREVAELQEMGAYVRHLGNPVDVDLRLQLFKARQANRQPKNARIRYIRYAMAAAAVLLVAFLSVEMLRGWRDIKPNMAAQQEACVVFSTEGEQSGVSLMTEKGEQVVLSPQTQQNTSLTLADFRKVFAKGENVEQVTLQVPVGKSADITLPDGSVVYLHPGSKVIFPTAFVGPQRIVQLDGMAYFKVAKDAEHPFVVSTGEWQTTVLGTEFHIDTDAREVVLVSGSVRVNAGGREALLKPAQKLTIASQLAVEEVDVTPYEYWRDGYLYFDNVELKTIMEDIGRNFNMTVEFRNEAALHLKMRFIAERNQGIDAALEMMNRMKKVTVHKEGNRILVD
ncbi:MAG: FecR domain-containing protein, partial [Prevotella sp.]|nr:FecR domain-containing protein [Prevotella sp.]